MKKTFKEQWNERLAEAQQKEDKMSKPEIRDTPEATKHYRKIGFMLFVLGCAFAVANFATLMMEGRILIISFSVMIFCIPFGLWLVAFGKLPRWFTELNKHLKKGYKK